MAALKATFKQNLSVACFTCTLQSYKERDAYRFYTVEDVTRVFKARDRGERTLLVQYIPLPWTEVRAVTKEICPDHEYTVFTRKDWVAFDEIFAAPKKGENVTYVDKEEEAV